MNLITGMLHHESALTEFQAFIAQKIEREIVWGYMVK